MEPGGRGCGVRAHLRHAGMDGEPAAGGASVSRLEVRGAGRLGGGANRPVREGRRATDDGGTTKERGGARSFSERPRTRKEKIGGFFGATGKDSLPRGRR